MKTWLIIFLLLSGNCFADSSPDPEFYSKADSYNNYTYLKTDSNPVGLIAIGLTAFLVGMTADQKTVGPAIEASGVALTGLGVLLVKW